jgi:hypothetical protein
MGLLAVRLEPHQYHWLKPRREKPGEPGWIHLAFVFREPVVNDGPITTCGGKDRERPCKPRFHTINSPNFSLEKSHHFCYLVVNIRALV